MCGINKTETMISKFYLAVIAIVVFAIYLLLVWLIRLSTGLLPIEDGIFGVFKEHDFIIAFVVVGFVILARYRQKRKEKK